MREVQFAGIAPLRQGDRVSYKIVSERRSGRPKADGLKRLEPAA
jgi:cold shock CspA family protein